MRCRWPFTRPVHASGLEKDDVGNVRWKPLGIIGTFRAVACWTGVMAASMVVLLLGVPLMSSANNDAALWPVLNREDASPW
jgi:hypothetical protein